MEDRIRNEILQGLQQVDESFTITDFHLEFDRQGRGVKAAFTATNDEGETVSEVISYA